MLPDVLIPGLKVVMCGTAVGEQSAQVQQYYAKPGNKFWATLYEVGLTPVQLSPHEYAQITKHGIGLTDLVKVKAGMDHLLTDDDFDFELFGRNINYYQPAYLCFNGKGAAKKYFRRKRVEYGLQLETIRRTKIFVAPSTSGRGRRWWNIEYWRELARLCSLIEG